MKEKLITAFIEAVKNPICMRRRNDTELCILTMNGTEIITDTYFPDYVYEENTDNRGSFIKDTVQNIKINITYKEYWNLLKIYENEDKI